jgi:hypothetical protein
MKSDIGMFQQVPSIFGHNLAAMKNLLGWFPCLQRPASILSTAAPLPPFNRVTLSLICLGSLLFLIGGLTSRKGVRGREQWLMSLTGLFGLLYAGLNLFWHFHARFLQSRALAIGYYFAWHLVGGIALGMLLYVGFPKGAKVLLTVSAILLVAFNVFVIIHHLASAILFLCMVNSLVIGVLIPSAAVLWLNQPKKNNNESGNV